MSAPEMGLVAREIAERAAARYLMRKKLLNLQSNLSCSCGRILTVVEELDAHLDHFIEHESAKGVKARITRLGEVLRKIQALSGAKVVAGDAGALDFAEIARLCREASDI